MALFLSTYVNKVDRKGRVSVPADFRSELAGQRFNGIVAFRGFTRLAIDASGIDRMERFAAELDSLDPESDRAQEVQAILADSRRLAFDGEGRIVLPGDLSGFAQIGEEAHFVGQGANFLICNAEVAAEIVRKPLTRRHGPVA